jgi:8-hydroxy-5-deazaflavin:NADPH oxidoreductase
VKIGIIGAGMIGGSLTRRFQALGHDVTVANSRGPYTLTELVAETGARAGTVADAIDAGDLVVLAVPVAAVPHLDLSGLTGKIVIDANNYYASRDGRIPELASKRVPSSRWIADHIPGARVVKVFNNIFWRHLREKGVPAGTPGRIALPLAGDDPEAKRIVGRLVDELGFDAVDGGTLDESWRQQPDTPVYGSELDAAGVRAALAATTR